MGFEQQQFQRSQTPLERATSKAFENEDAEITRKVIEPEFRTSEDIVTYYDESKGAWVKGIQRTGFPELNTRDITTSNLEDSMFGDKVMIQYKVTILSLQTTQRLYGMDMKEPIDFFTRNMHVRANILKARGGKTLLGVLVKQIKQIIDQTINENSNNKGGGLNLFNPNKQ